MNAEVLIKFKGDTSDADSKTKKMSSSLGQLTKAFTLGNLAAKGISKAIQIFNQGLDGAISRSDTLKNFPKVMSNLGIGTEEASSAISTLSDKLKGLPTSLDSAAMSVQRLTSKNGNVEDSTKIFLALNNAILAGGASAETQASAIEQISQAYAKGKPDMMEWRSMMTAMPAQLKQVATAMGYVDADALGSALRDGSASMDDFMNTIVKLNETGVDGFANFETQARNATGGIQTSITNMKTAIVRGITNIIESVNTALEPFGGLAGVIGTVGQIGEQMFTAIGQGLAMIMPGLITLFQNIMPIIEQYLNEIMPLLNNIFNKGDDKMKIYICAAKRTAIGSMLGTLKNVHPADFASIVVKNLLEETKLEPKYVDELISGNVMFFNLFSNSISFIRVLRNFPSESICKLNFLPDS